MSLYRKNQIMVKGNKKTSWQTKKLVEVCDIGAGNSAPQKKEFFVDGVYPFFRTSDIGKIHIGTISESSDYLNEKGAKVLKLFNKGTILLPKSGASTFLNHRVILGTDGYVSSHLATIKTNEEVLNNSYLFYFLHEIKAQDLIQDHKYPSLNLPVIGNILIPLPPLPEQHRLVKILDEVFEKTAKAKENAEKNLQNAKELFESYLQSVFANPGKDWEDTTINKVCEKLFAGGDVPKNNLSKIKTEKYNVPIFANGIKKKGLYGYTDIKKVIEPSITISARGTIGYAEIRREIFYPVVRLIVLIPNTKIIELSFLYYITRNFKFSNTGTSIPQLTVPMIKDIKISIPSIRKQKNIVKNIDALSAETKKLESIYKQKLADLEELRKSVLRKAFAGEL